MVDIERIRVAAEREALLVLEAQEAFAKRSFVVRDPVVTRREILANGLFLSETMAPEAYEAAHAAMAALGVDDRIELFQTSGHGTDNARIALLGRPIGVEFIGAFLDRLDRGPLLAVIGHEIGHALAHCGHPMFGWAMQACGGYAQTDAKRAFSVAAELTADRFGLLACRDLDTVLRLEMQTSAGPVARSIRFDTEAYLAQCRAVAEETIAKGGVAHGSSHPEHYVRGYAEWLFSESDVYRSITGVGSGARSIEEVDAILDKLIGVPRRSTAPTTIAKPPPRPVAVSPSRPIAGPESARSKLEATRNVLAEFASAAVPSLRRWADAARDSFDVLEKAPVDDASDDPLEDDRRDLLARFEALERRAKQR